MVQNISKHNLESIFRRFGARRYPTKDFALASEAEPHTSLKILMKGGTDGLYQSNSRSSKHR